MRTRTVEQRLWNRVDRSDPEECWLWPRSTCQGYGRININGKMHQAHRVAWELTNGPIPDGLFDTLEDAVEAAAAARAQLMPWSLDSTRQEVSHA